MMIQGMLMALVFTTMKYVDNKVPFWFFGKEIAARREKEGKRHTLLSAFVIVLLFAWALILLVALAAKEKELYIGIIAGIPALLFTAALVSRRVAGKRLAAKG